MVPHSALRFAVMGERGLSEVASADDRERLCAALRDALAAEEEDREEQAEVARYGSYEQQHWHDGRA